MKEEGVKGGGAPKKNKLKKERTNGKTEIGVLDAAKTVD